MRSTHILGTLICSVVLLPACLSSNPEKEEDTMKAELIFQTGFEPASEVISQSNSGADIIGKDASVEPPNDWVMDLETHSNIGDFNVQYQGGDPSQRLASIVEDPTESGNHVLRYWMNRPNVDTTKSYGGKFRIQTNLYGNEGLKSIYYRYRFYLTEDWKLVGEREEKMEWFILGEYWNNGGWTGEDFVFRMHLTLSKDEGSGKPLYLGLSGQTKPDGWKTYWHEDNHDFEVPVEEWVDMEIWLNEGGADTGRFWLRAKTSSGEPEVIFNVKNYTHHPEDPSPDGYSHLNPLKGYSHRDNILRADESGGTLQILWDDFVLYTGMETEPK